MSADETDQADLDEFKTALQISDETTESKPNWEPQQDDGPNGSLRVQCEHCDNSVLADFARVFGDNQNRLINGCPACSTYREISGLDRNGSGTGKRGDR